MNWIWSSGCWSTTSWKSRRSAITCSWHRSSFGAAALAATRVDGQSASSVNLRDSMAAERALVHRARRCRDGLLKRSSTRWRRRREQRITRLPRRPCFLSIEPAGAAYHGGHESRAVKRPSRLLWSQTLVTELRAVCRRSELGSPSRSFGAFEFGACGCLSLTPLTYLGVKGAEPSTACCRSAGHIRSTPASSPRPPAPSTISTPTLMETRR